MTLPAYKDLSPDALRDWLAASGAPAFRLKQINDWLWQRWVVDFHDMSNLSKELRDTLAASFRACSLELEGAPQIAPDGTRKYLFRLHDGQHIETVLIPAPGRHTVCISTQVGCSVRCVFCASGRDGLVRSLTMAEIVDQVVFACRDLGERVNNIVVMGMGEPMLNLEHLIPALECLSDPERFGFGARHITVSTSGIVPGIRELAACGRQWNLALSLHAASEESRQRLIPDGQRYPILEIMAACREYREKSGRMVTLEYVLIQGRNDSGTDLAGLTRLARDLHAKVNLIPYNATSDGAFRPPEKGAVRRFADDLAKAGVQVSVRREMGSGIDAACGQLRARHLEDQPAVPRQEPAAPRAAAPVSPKRPFGADAGGAPRRESPFRPAQRPPPPREDRPPRREPTTARPFPDRLPRSAAPASPKRPFGADAGGAPRREPPFRSAQRPPPPREDRPPRRESAAARPFPDRPSRSAAPSSLKRPFGADAGGAPRREPTSRPPSRPAQPPPPSPEKERPPRREPAATGPFAARARAAAASSPKHFFGRDADGRSSRPGRRP
jgi:23S rRNA (adenine2503-C2)-methyltransferase